MPLKALTLAVEGHCFMSWQDRLKPEAPGGDSNTPATEGKTVTEIKCGSQVTINLHVLRCTHYTSWGPGKKTFSHCIRCPGKGDSTGTNLSAINPFPLGLAKSPETEAIKQQKWRVPEFSALAQPDCLQDNRRCKDISLASLLKNGI